MAWTPATPVVYFLFQLPLLTSSLSLCSGKQLEEGSGTWTGSSLRRTFSFLLGMTGRDKVGVNLGKRGIEPLLFFSSLSPSPTLLLETREGLSL